MHLLLITTYYEPDSGAAAVRLARLARLLAQRGHRVTVLTAMPHYPAGRIHPAYRGKGATVEWRGGVQVVRAWLYATPSPRISRKLISQNSFMLSALRRGLALPRPDVMLIEAQPVFTGFAGALLARFKRVPYVLNVSDLWPDHLLSVGALAEDHPAYRTARFLVDRSYRGAAAITTLSPTWADAIAGYIGGREKLHLIYNGVDLTRFRPDPAAGAAFRGRHGLGDNKLVAFIGTFATQYDFEALFTAARRLAHRQDVTFVFIGGGSQAEQVAAAADLPNLRLIDWIDHDSVPGAWNAADIAWWALRDQPLYHGTIPAKLYEALACGVPVVAAMAGAGAALLNSAGGGVSVPPGDPNALTDALVRLLDDDALRESDAAAGRMYAETHFDPMRVAERYERVLLDVTGDIEAVTGLF